MATTTPLTRTSENARSIEILLVEDNPGDVRLIKEAFRDSKIVNGISCAVDGVEALDFLHRQGKYAEANRPDLVLLDLNLPRKDGREVLAEIKADPDLKRIPVVILTSSKSEEDILKTYNLHANCYITKPIDLEKFIGVAKAIENFWVSIVKLPPR
ncbi:MAG: response regulator [Acidobacteriia bacterium]|nr:response regulator [Terriglobia bacterium]